MVPTPSHAGQIVRINLENFMSYDNIEIYPGPHLNLIIGPNGTGKSSIVCAVLLGLGGKLKTLGRADQLSSYVKSGCDQSCIEIELFEPKGSNVVIKRKISSNNQSEFMINGLISTAAKVSEVRKMYNIQIDNLCTFLPQEKVQDFAKLNAQQLLDHTQRTVGNGELVQLHEELKKLQAVTVSQEKHNNVLQADLDSEKQKNDRLKDKIRCFKEKQSLCDKLVVLNQKKAWLSYQKEMSHKEEIDNDAKMAEKAYNEKMKEIEKFNKELLKLDSKLNAFKQKLYEAKKNETGKKTVMEDWLKRADRRLDSLEDLRNVVQSKLNEEEAKKKEMIKHKESIEKLTNDLRTLEANIGSESELRKRKEEVDRQLRTIHGEETRLNQMKIDLEEDEETVKQELRNTTSEYQALIRRRNVRLEYLKRHEPDVYKAMQWLENHRHIFQSRIYNPMLLELDVPNTKMAKFVESRLGYRDLISFTCTNPDDLNLMVKKLRTERKLKVNIICSNVYDSTQFSPDIPITSLRTYGFHSYMRELITGPEDIIRFLCKTYRIHCIPVGDENVKTNCGRVPQTIPLFYSSNHVFSVKYSIYSGDKSISVKKLNEAKFFIESLDDQRIQILAGREKDLESKLKSKQSEVQNIDRKLNGLRRMLEEVKKKKRDLGTNTEKRQEIQLNLKRAISNYNTVKSTLKNPSDIEEEAKQERQKLQDEISKNLEELKQACENAKKSILTRQRCELEYKVNRMERTQIFDEKERLTEELSHAQELLKETKERQQSAELLCLQLKEKAKQLTENISMEERGFSRFQDKFTRFSNSIEELENEIEETRAKSEFLQGGSLQIVQEYEKREERIAQLTTSLESLKKTLEDKRQEFITKRERWLNPVNKLVSQINVNFGKFFEAMGCAGEVCLVSGENQYDFDQYGIKIRVKFRDNAPLQELGRYFQSGGERAVATAIFMLSLQELTSVPFRFVDEINQGMDPANEKRILQLIIRVTAPEHSSQYFFITPKLLNDLQCSETMTVHCIYNGPNAIPTTEWDFKKFLKRFAKAQVEDDEVDDK